MRINYSNKEVLDEQYMHDSEFTGFSYEYDTRQIRFSCENWYMKKISHLLFKNVAYCESQSCGFWGKDIKRIYWVSVDDSPEAMERLRKLQEEKKDRFPSFIESGQFLQVLIELISGDTLLIICEELEFEEEEWNPEWDPSVSN